MKFLKRLGKELSKTLPLLGKAVFAGHPVVGRVLEVLNITHTDSEDIVLQKLTPEAIDRLQIAKLDQEYRLHELDLQYVEKELESFSQAQETVRTMLRSESAFTRNGIPATIWVYVLAHFWQIIGLGISTYVIQILVILMADSQVALQVLAIPLPTATIPTEFGTTVATLMLGVLAKRSYDQTEIRGEKFSKLRKE